MKKVLFLLLMLLPMMAQAQKVKEICGAKWGMSYSQAKKALAKTLGTSAQYVENQYIMYQGLNYEGIMYTQIVFAFKHKDSFWSNSGPIMLKEAQFLVICETEDEAIDKCRQIAGVMKRKYDVEEIEKDGLPGFYGGENPHNDALRGFSIRPILVDDVHYAALAVWPSPFN